MSGSGDRRCACAGTSTATTATTRRRGLAVVVLLARPVVGTGALGAAVCGRSGLSFAGGGPRRAFGEGRADRSRAVATAATATRPGLVGAFRGGVRGTLGPTGALGLDGFGLRRRHQAALRALRDVQVFVQVGARRVGLDRLRLTELERPVDEGPLVQVLPVDERDRDAGLARTPVRPARCRYVLSSSGMVWLMTCVTSSTSMPRAATSVATRTLRLPALNAAIERSRWSCPMSPCTPPTLKPRSLSSSTRRCAARLVRVKITVLPRPSAWRMRAMISSLSIECAR